MSRTNSFPLLLTLFGLLFACAEPVDSIIPTGPQIPSIDDSSSISMVTWNIENFPQAGNRTLDRVQLIMDSLDADFYCLQEIKDKDALVGMIGELPQYSVIISEETSYLHLAIVYKQASFLPVATENLFADDDYNFARRPPLLVQYAYETDGIEQVINIINLHMKCCERSQEDVDRRHNASQMLHDYLIEKMAWGDSNFVILGDWNDDIYDPDGSGQYSFNAFLDDTNNFFFATDSLAATRSVNNASYPSYNSFIDNILISQSFFDEYLDSEVRTLRLDLVFGEYSSIVSDHRPILWSFSPN